MTRKKSVSIFAVTTFLLCQPAVWFLNKGVLDDLDFWGATVIIVLGATLEIILLAWVFGIDRAWEELLTDADKSVLMAKSLFGQSVEDVHLGEVAGVDEHLLRAAIKKLAAISFFELDREPQRKLRIRTHPLAQEFTHRVLRNNIRNLKLKLKDDGGRLMLSMSSGISGKWRMNLCSRNRKMMCPT